MNVVCPTCGTEFALDEAQLPPGGGRVRCPACSGAVAVELPLELDLDEPASDTTPSGGPPAVAIDVSADVPTELEAPADVRTELEAPADVLTELEVSADVPTELEVSAEVPSELGPPADVLTEVEVSADVPTGLEAPAGVLTELEVSADVPAELEAPAEPSMSEPSLATPQDALALGVEATDAVVAPTGPEVEVAPQVVELGRVSALGMSTGVLDVAAPEDAAGPVSDPRPEREKSSACAEEAVSRARPEPASAAVSSSPVVIASESHRPGWYLYAVFGGVAAAAMVVVAVVSAATQKPPAPPEMPNPLRARVAMWVAAGHHADPPTVEGAVRAARAGLARGTHEGMRAALHAARSALLVDADAPAAVAAYGQVLAWWPDRVAPEDLDEALGAITSAVGEDPDSAHRADLEIARTWLHLRTGKVEAARQAAKRALDRVGSAEARVAYAVSRLRTRAEEAATELQAVVSGGDAPVRANRWLGEAYLRSGDVARALRVWRAAGMGPEAIEVMRRLARLAIDMGDVAVAQTRLEAIEAAGWAGVEDRLLLARVYGRVQRRPDEALAQLDAGLADADLSDLNRARLICEKVVVVANNKNAKTSPAEVSSWLDIAFELAPDLPELLYAAGVVDAAGSVDDAINSLEAATDVAPQRPEPALLLALLLREEAPRDARQVVNQALEETPHYVPLHLMRAVLDLDAQDRTAAHRAVRRALDFDPEHSRRVPRLDEMFEPVVAYQRIAKLLSRWARGGDYPMLLTAAGMAQYFAGDFAKANATLNRAVRADPRGVGARLYRAIIALGRKKRSAAKRDLDAALDADSQHRVVRYYRARLAESGRKTLDDAERLYRDLLDANPLDGGARVGLARVLYARGAHEESRAEVLKVLTSRPRDRAALAFLVQSAQRSDARRRRR